MSKETKDLVKQDGAGFSITAQDIRDLIDVNLGGQLDAMSLDRIKIPAGGGVHWTVPSLDGEDVTKALEGVIVYISYQNAYWSQTMEESGGGTPPDCSAMDATHGVGNPGGLCATCPLNQFGSDTGGGRGKECKNMLMLFLQQEGNILPMVVALPPTSLKIVKKYFLRMTSAGIPYFGVVSRLELVKTKNEKGIEYSVVDVKTKQLREGETSADRIKLDPSTLAGVESYRAALIPALSSISVEYSDITE